jgi:Chorismate synthase
LTWRTVEIQSGTEHGYTLGSPIAMRVMNENQRKQDYGNSTMDKYPRPSHADWTYQEKYGIRASSGGGRSSARETIGIPPSLLLKLTTDLIGYCRTCSSRRYCRKGSKRHQQRRNRCFRLLCWERIPFPTYSRTPNRFHKPRFPFPP